MNPLGAPIYSSVVGPIHDGENNKKSAKQGDARLIVFFIVDDTQSKRDYATTKMEGLDEHFSHSDGKSVCSHSIVNPN